MNNAANPPGPKGRFPGELLLAFNRDPTGFLLSLARNHGDIAHFRLGSLRVFLLSHPDLVKEVLVTRHRCFKQGLARRQAKRIIGEGLITTEGEVHLRKRRLLQPIFHRRHVETYGTTIAEFASETSENWREGETMDIAHAMWRLALRITSKTIFATSVETEAEEISRSIDNLTAMFNPLMIVLADWLFRFPSPQRRRYEEARARLDNQIDRIIRVHRESGDKGDLLSMILAAREGGDGDAPQSEQEVRDEALEAFLAAHGTIALALAWTFYLLAQHPEVEAKLLVELDAVLGGRTPTVADVESLTYTRMVLTEGMRLYPPTWVLDRETIEDYELGGYSIPAGSTVLVSQWVTHHDPRYFPDPFHFDPERWSPGRKVSLPEFAYFPFGGGPRLCIGEPLAWLEGVMVLAIIARRWRMRLVPEQQVELRPRFSLEPKNGIHIKLERRAPIDAAPHAC